MHKEIINNIDLFALDLLALLFEARLGTSGTVETAHSSTCWKWLLTPINMEDKY